MNFTNNTHFLSPQAVHRGSSETQLQVAENLNFSAQCSQGLKCLPLYDIFNIVNIYNKMICIVCFYK